MKAFELRDAIKKKIAEIKTAIEKFYTDEYRLVQYHNPLTEEIYFYIEERKSGKRKWTEWKIEAEVYQQKFGCDADGMFNDITKAKFILKFLKGHSKVTKKIVTNISYENE